MLSFACLSPHAPIFLPKVSSSQDRQEVKSTISSLESLAPKLAATKPEIIIISSPHQDWGVNVPAYFLLGKDKKEKMEMKKYQPPDNFFFDKNPSGVYPILTNTDSPEKHYQFGKLIARKMPLERSISWIASGDMSHVLKKEGPYGFNPTGKKFDQKFIELLKKKDIKGILNLDPFFIEEAAVCGLWSFCLLFGVLDGLSLNWTPKVLSYEGPFGVGYLVAQIQINEK